ncbi:subtilisin-like serine protease [Ceratobasidium sp. 392]|nr:subtilisin-like serine protease [Ceratobasidium sp. 392]
MLAFISIAALSVLIPALAAPTNTENVPLTEFAGRVKANSYIVKLKDNVSKDAHLTSIISKFIAGSSLQYKYDDVFHGYAINLKGKDLDFLRQSKDIEYITEDGIATIDFLPGDESEAVKRSHEPTKPLSARAGTGAGVDVYDIDTGIYTGHQEFGGRARWGATYGGYANADGNGHGTHTAGTVGGSSVGQAPGCSLIAVKDYNNNKASFSNYGPIVDIQAYGVNVRSTWIGSPSAYNTISGTSMATPYVAGILAAEISQYGNKSPAALATDLKNYARAIAGGEPSGTTNKVATKW